MSKGSLRRKEDTGKVIANWPWPDKSDDAEGELRSLNQGKRAPTHAEAFVRALNGPQEPSATTNRGAEQ